MRNIDEFMKLKVTYMKELPVKKRNGLLSEIKNLRKLFEKGCVCCIQPSGGTENCTFIQIENQSGEGCVSSFVLCLQQPY